MALCVVDEKGDDRGERNKESMWCHFYFKQGESWIGKMIGVWFSMAVCGEPTLVLTPLRSANGVVVGVCGWGRWIQRSIDSPMRITNLMMLPPPLLCPLASGFVIMMN